MASARRKRATLGLVALAAMLGAAVGASAHGLAPPARPTLAADAGAVQAELAGIPQQGLVLGSSTAPVTVVEYADLVCLPCASAATNVLSSVIGDYVRQGTVRLVLAPITQSQRSSLYAYGTYAAGLQGQAWDFALLAYARSTARGDGPTDQPAGASARAHVERPSLAREPLPPALGKLDPRHDRDRGRRLHELSRVHRPRAAGREGPRCRQDRPPTCHPARADRRDHGRPGQRRPLSSAGRGKSRLALRCEGFELRGKPLRQPALRTAALEQLETQPVMVKPSWR